MTGVQTCALPISVTGNMFGHRKRESATRYTARERAGEMNVRDVARRIGGQDSHPGFHRVLANGYPLDALIRISQAFAAKTAVGRHARTGFDHHWVASRSDARRVGAEWVSTCR